MPIKKLCSYHRILVSQFLEISEVQEHQIEDAEETLKNFT